MTGARGARSTGLRTSHGGNAAVAAGRGEGGATGGSADYRKRTSAVVATASGSCKYCAFAGWGVATPALSLLGSIKTCIGGVGHRCHLRILFSLHERTQHLEYSHVQASGNTFISLGSIRACTDRGSRGEWACFPEMAISGRTRWEMAFSMRRFALHTCLHGDALSSWIPLYLLPAHGMSISIIAVLQSAGHVYPLACTNKTPR